MGFIRDDLRSVAERFPDRTAVAVVGGASMTYAEWLVRAGSLAAGLVGAGVSPGDRVGLLLPNDHALDFATGYVATHIAGAVAVPINPRYADRELEHILGNAEPRVVIAAGAQIDRLDRVRGRGDQPFRVVAPGAAGSGALDLDELVEAGAPAPDVPLRDDDLADIFYTSGTTGLPKGVASTHANAALLDASPFDDGGVFLHAMPLPTFTGVHGAIVSPMRMGLSVHVQPRFDAPAFGRLIEQLRAKFVLMVPAHILLLLRSAILDEVDTSTVVTVMFGGAPTPPDAVQALDAAFPNAFLINGYGLTEGGGSVCALPPGEAAKRPGSVGKPMGGVTIRIVDEDGAEIPAGQIGEITLDIPAGERSYYRDPDLTARTWRDGWVHTGDVGYVDEDGFLYVVDRVKDVINRGGYNVYSVEVEDAVFAHPAVAEVAAVGVDHPVLGQDVCVVVRFEEGAAPLSLEELRAFTADRLADYKQPRRLVVVEDPLPRTSAHKLDKRAIAELIAS